MWFITDMSTESLNRTPETNEYKTPIINEGVLSQKHNLINKTNLVNKNYLENETL